MYGLSTDEEEDDQLMFSGLKSISAKNMYRKMGKTRLSASNNKNKTMHPESELGVLKNILTIGKRFQIIFGITLVTFLITCVCMVIVAVYAVHELKDKMEVMARTPVLMERMQDTMKRTTAWVNDTYHGVMERFPEDQDVRFLRNVFETAESTNIVSGHVATVAQQMTPEMMQQFTGNATLLIHNLGAAQLKTLIEHVDQLVTSVYDISTHIDGNELGDFVQESDVLAGKVDGLLDFIQKSNLVTMIENLINNTIALESKLNKINTLEIQL